MIDNMLIRPFVSPKRLTVTRYLEFLQNELSILLEDIFLAKRAHMIFQYDGAPTHYNLQRRLMLCRRHYFYTKIGPFSLVLTLPELYGFFKIKYEPKQIAEIKQNSKILAALRRTKNWKIHPEWLYCKYYGSQRMNFSNPEEELLHFLDVIEKRGWTWYKYCQPALVNTLILDAKATEWIEEHHIAWNELMKKYQVGLIFMATHSGLIRWRTNHETENTPQFILKNRKSIDEIWYKRSVDYNAINPRVYIYSVPFEGIDNNTFVTATNAIFRESGQKKASVGVLGFQIAHFALESVFKRTVSDCGNKTCPHTCDSEELKCYVLDNNAYIIVSDEGHTGEFIGNVRPDIMKHLVANGIYRQTRLVDYQDICYLDPPQPETSDASKVFSIWTNICGIFKWIITTILYLIKSISGAVVKDNSCLRAITSEYVKRAIRKTLPTPCDRQRWLFTLDRDSYSRQSDNIFVTPDCLWPYIVQPIPGSNLILLVMNGPCSSDTHFYKFPFTPEPEDLEYNLSMPCYIATKNNYTRRQYITCINNHQRENTLNLDQFYCGVTWKI